MIVSICIILLSFVTLIVAWKLSHGKWLRFMAGNTFPTISKDKQIKMGKIVGKAFYVIALFPIALLVITNLNIKNKTTLLILIVTGMIILVFIPTIYALKKVSKID